MHYKATVYQVLLDSREPVSTEFVRETLNCPPPLNVNSFLHDGLKTKLVKATKDGGRNLWTLTSAGRSYMARVRAEIPSIADLKEELQRRVDSPSSKYAPKNSFQPNIKAVSKTEQNALESLGAILDENRELKLFLRDLERRLNTLLYTPETEEEEEL